MLQEEAMRLPRFTVRRLMVAVAVIALSIGCLLWMIRATVERVELAPQPTWASIDHDIFDLVLADLLVNEEFNPAVGDRRLSESQIVLGDTTLRGFNLPITYLDSWMKENKVSLEILDDLAARNPKGIRYSLARFHPSIPNILVRNMSEIDRDLGFFSSQFPNARGYVETLLPSYSRDGLTALMRFSFGPTHHEANGYYLLKKVRGRWEIVGRSIRYYA
jgi:hypothetical protein